MLSTTWPVPVLPSLQHGMREGQHRPASPVIRRASRRTRCSAPRVTLLMVHAFDQQITPVSACSHLEAMGCVSRDDGEHRLVHMCWHAGACPVKPCPICQQT